MGVVLYSNGILKDYRPQVHTFTESEIVQLFTEFQAIRTVRVPALVNTWVIFGTGDPDPGNYNKIVSDIVREHIYSHAIFVHDSEIDPSWNATDNILYKGYTEFVEEIKATIDAVSLNILNQFQANTDYENKVNYLPLLVSVGETPDNRILFSFNPDDQSKEFYTHDEFYRFSQKVYDFIATNKQEKEPFTIFADKKAIIIIDPLKVKSFLTSVLETFKSKEEYEICNNITKIMKDWSKVLKGNVEITPVKKPRRKKSDTTTDKSNEQH